MGIYSLTWVFQFLYHIQPASSRKPPTVASSITKYPKTGADEKTSVILNFPETGAHGIATATLRVASDPSGDQSAGPPIRIQGEKGEIQVYGPAFRPTRYRLIPRHEDADPPMEPRQVEEVTREIPGHGMFWEADECARCLMDGKKESEGIGLDESVAIMRVMDEIRKQADLVYPERIESTQYPLEGF